LVRKKKN